MSRFFHRFPKNLVILVIIWALGTICDRVWLSLDNSIPAWDQADYLTGTLNYSRALQHPQFNNTEWWQSFWLLSSKIPPLIYIISGLIQGLIGAGPDQAMLVMLLFNGILITSVYGLGKVLFSPIVGLWAAALCQVLPGIYRLRLQFLLDYPLAAIVTFCFFCLTVWHLGIDGEQNTKQSEPKTRESFYTLIKKWFWAGLFGFAFGVALLVKQSALLFLLIPIVWVIITTLRSKRWGKLLQFAGGLWISSLIFGGWYRTNWLTILTSGKRATIDSAIAEGDAPLNTIDAWIFYWQQLPYQVTLPLLLVPILIVLFDWGKAGTNRKREREISRTQEGKPRTKTAQLTTNSLKWLAIFWVGAYLLSSLNLNKDDRYVVPYLPVLTVVLAYGLTRMQNLLGQRVRWGSLGLAILLMGFNLFPVDSFVGSWITQVLSPSAQNRPYLGSSLPHKEIIAEIFRTEPYLRSTIGVLPSTSEINQHNLNYYGALVNFQVYGRQVGTREKQVEQDIRSLSWFVTKTGQQGSVPKSQASIVQAVETSSEFQLRRTWQLGDGSILKLYHRQQPSVEVAPRPLQYSSLDIIREKSNFPTPVTLMQVTIPENASPGLPIPVTYKWSGPWEELKNSLILITWHHSDDTPTSTRDNSVTDNLATNKSTTDKLVTDNPKSQWFHDHAIGMGNLHVGAKKPEGSFQVIERTAMLTPADIAPGKYTVEATYLNRVSGEVYKINVPNTTININPQVAPTPAPELDLVTQFCSLGRNLPKGTQAVEQIFAEVARINQYDPTQDYLIQARLTNEYRLQHSSKNSDLAYTIALANVLQRRVDKAISSLEIVTQIDRDNPFAWAYLAFVHLYNWQPHAAEKALKPALDKNPNQREFKALSGVAALMQGNLIKAWRDLSKSL